MSFLRRSIDVANAEIQFEVTENANSINLKFNPEFAVHIPDVTVRVEKITKNATNKVLYSGRLSEIKEILKFAFPNLTNVLPFAIGKSLILNDDDRILVTLTLGEEMPTSFEYEVNKTVETTQNPLVIKKVAIDEELSFSTEFYPLLLLPTNVDSYETIVLLDDGLGKLVPNKIYFGKNLINSQMQTGHTFLPMVTASNQEVTVKGLSTVYLVLVS